MFICEKPVAPLLTQAENMILFPLFTYTSEKRSLSLHLLHLNPPAQAQIIFSEVTRLNLKAHYKD